MAHKDIAFIENKVHPSLRLNAICPYFTMFPLSFPYKVLRRAKKSDLVYDPFCGRGTTNFAARLQGISSYGVDSNPIAQAIAQAKLLYISPDKIVERCTGILNTHLTSTIPQGEFWNLAYHPDTLNHLCIIRDFFMAQDELDDVDIALRAIILGVLHGPKMKTDPSYLSNQMPRTFATKPNYSVGFWEKKGIVADRVDLVDLIKRKSEYIFNKEIPRKKEGHIFLDDSRTFDKTFDKKINWVITSPPYYGMSTYKQDQWLRNWFLGGTSEVDYSNKSQINHGSEMSFINDLAKVWSNTAMKCEPNAKLIIRFGALPSKSDKTPSQLIKDSLDKSDCGWKVTRIYSAGSPSESQRQANQFKKVTGKYIEEIDVYATLKV